MSTHVRIYLVTTPTGKRLVEAANPARAVAHVVRKEITVAKPSNHELLALGKLGVEVEVDGGDAEQAPNDAQLELPALKIEAA